MKVLHVIPSLDRQDGGPSVALPMMARGLTAEGVTVECVATMSEADAEEQGIVFGEPVPHAGCTVRFFKRQTNFYKVSLPMLGWLWKHAKDYDLIHNHALFSFAPLVGALAAWRKGVPYIMRPLGLLNHWGMENRRRWIKALSMRFLDRPALDGAAAIHYTSVVEEGEAARLGLRGRAVVVPLGIDLTPFGQLPDPAVFFDQFPLARGRQMLLFLSRVHPKKGVELLLDAVAELTRSGLNPVLVIAGDGDPVYVGQLKAKVLGLGIQDSVIWAGFLNGESKLAAFSAASVFVLPSYSENFGIALLEAMAAGLPCVATPGVALAHDAAPALRMVEPEPSAIAAAIRSLLADPAEASRLGASAKACANDHFSSEASAKGLLALYADLVKVDLTAANCVQIPATSR